MIGAKRALDSAKVVVDYCKEQRSCQNCIFRLYGVNSWKCHMQVLDLDDILVNVAAKRKNGGYIG